METKSLLVLAPTNESLDMDFVLELKTMLVCLELKTACWSKLSENVCAEW